jgi:hypothetical protein
MYIYNSVPLQQSKTLLLEQEGRMNGGRGGALKVGETWILYLGSESAKNHRKMYKTDTG